MLIHRDRRAREVHEARRNARLSMITLLENSCYGQRWWCRTIAMISSITSPSLLWAALLALPPGHALFALLVGES
jgi:hypothetical protein